MALHSKGMPTILSCIRQRMFAHAKAYQPKKGMDISKDVRRQALPDNGDAETAAKAEALKNVMAEINKKHGKNTVMYAPEFKKQDGEVLKTGVMTLDIVLAGGWPKGRLIEVFGPESSGKTTLCLTAIRELHKQPGNKHALFIDAEHALDLKFCNTLGIDQDRLIVIKPDSGEQALDGMLSLIQSGAVDLVVLDSVAALIPKMELEAEFGTPTMGGHARLMSSGLKKIVIAAQQTKTTVMFTNQIRQKIGVIFGNPEYTTGGKALLFYASVRVDVRKIKVLSGPKKGEDDLGIKVRAKIVKSKTSAPLKVTEFDILWNSGVDQVGCVFDAGVKLGVIRASGSHYYHKEEKLGQGRDKVLEYLKSNEAKLNELEQQITSSITEETDASVLLSGEPVDFDENGQLLENDLGLEEEFSDDSVDPELVQPSARTA